jgi:Dit-like phage tail protein
MVITDYRVKRDKDTGAALHFTTYLKQIIIVKSQSATIPASQIGGSLQSQQQAASNLAAGNQGTGSVSADIQRKVFKDPFLSGQLGAAAGVSAADRLLP